MSDKSHMTPEEQKSAVKVNCQMVIEFMAEGNVIPFLGAGVNRSDRPDGATFELGQHLPDGRELSLSIADFFHYPDDWGKPEENLMRVAWHAAALTGEGDLYRHLFKIFSPKYPLTSVHNFFASVPDKLRKLGYPDKPRLIVTTNYDQLLERAFDAAKEPYDVLSYVAKNEDDPTHVGKFKYVQSGKTPRILIDPNDFELSNTTVILKIHGAVHDAWNSSSFVITEDHYLDYLERMVKSFEIPAQLVAEMRYKHFLFLGYSLADWNLRVLLNIITRGRPFDDWSWAIMDRPKPWDQDYWEQHQRKVRLIEWKLKDYISILEDRLKNLAPFKNT